MNQFDTLFPAYFVPATDSEQLLVKSVLRKAEAPKLNKENQKNDATDSAVYIGTRLRECPEPIEDCVRGNSHWVTWHVEGEPALLVQIKPRRKRKRDETTNDPESEVKPGTQPMAAPPMFLMLAKDESTWRVRNTSLQVVFRLGVNVSYPTTVLEGVLARRLYIHHNREFQVHRDRTVAGVTMTMAEAAARTQAQQAVVGSAGDQGAWRSELVFFARECVWWRVPRIHVDDLQARCVLARTIIEGTDPANHLTANLQTTNV